MARTPSAGMGPASSTGSPMTFMMRPSVPAPTGTEIGAPVSVTGWPRTRPSEVSMAMHRTVFSPSCWDTSSTRRLPLFVVSRAFRISGRWPSNCTSTTAPMTCEMRPVALPAVVAVLAMIGSSRISSERLGARNDFDQFLGDHRLTRPVVGHRLLLDHFARVAGRIVHGAHAGALFGGGVLEQRAEDLHGEIARQERRQDLAFLGLVIVDRVGGTGAGLDLGRDDLLRRRDLGDHRTEARVEQRRHVELSRVEAREHLLGDHVALLEAELAHGAQVDELNDLLGELAT